jgi:hypothetical protein
MQYTALLYDESSQALEQSSSSLCRQEKRNYPNPMITATQPGDQIADQIAASTTSQSPKP